MNFGVRSYIEGGGVENIHDNPLIPYDERKQQEQYAQIKKEGEKSKEEGEKRAAQLIAEFSGNRTDDLSKSEVGKKIAEYLDNFRKNPEFYEKFEENTISEIVKAEDRLEEPLIYQAAALLLANLELGGSPYRGLSGYENSGLWVKTLLGKDHYNKFIEDKQSCIDNIENKKGIGSGQLQDVLANCEMNYIINNINGSSPEIPYFGYNNNITGSLLPKEFADRLGSLGAGWFNRSAVKDSYEKIGHTDFNSLKDDFERFMKSARFTGALSNLARMLSLAKDDKQNSEWQECFLICMLSGVLDFNGNENMRKQVYQWGKTMGFLPGMLVKNIGHSERVAALLDDFSNGDFSEKVKSFFHKGDLLKGKTKIGQLIEEVNMWWSAEMTQKFEQYSKEIFPTKKFQEGSALDQLQKRTNPKI